MLLVPICVFLGGALFLCVPHICRCLRYTGLVGGATGGGPKPLREEYWLGITWQVDRLFKEWPQLRICKSARTSSPACNSKEKATQDSVRVTQAHVGVADQQGWNSFQAQCGRNVVILSDHFLPVHMMVSSFCS